MRSNNFIKLTAGLAAAVFIAGCVQVYDEGTAVSDTTATGTDSTDGTIEIGVIAPLSGEAAVYGQPQQWILNVATEEINKAGGVGGKKISLKYEDGGCDSTLANKAASNLISVSQVKVIIGGFCSSETLAAAPIAEQNKVVLFSAGSSSPKITEAGDYIFRNYPSDNAQGELFADYATKKGYKKVGLLVEEQPYTEGIADTFKAVFEKSGGTAVIEKYSKDASDFRTQITKLQGEQVDLFFIDTQNPAKADLMIKQLNEAGIKGPFFINDSPLGDKEMLMRYKEYLEGTIGAEVPYDSANPKLIELQARYKAEMGKELPVPTYMAPSYDALYIIKEAIEKVGYDGTKIKDYLYTVKGRKGLAGTLSFDKNGDPDASFRHVLKIIKNGDVELYVE